MHRCIPLLFALATVATAAVPPPADSDRAAAFQRLRDDARIAKLLDQAAADIKARHFEPALAKAEAADALRPQDPIVLNTKGAALTELKRFDEAARTLEAAIAADPAAFAPQYNLGEMLALQKKFADAAVQFTVLQSRFGALPLLKYKLYLCHALQGRADLAGPALRAMRYPEDGPAWYFAHAVELIQAGKRGEARKLIAAAQAIHGGAAGTYLDTLRESGLQP